MFARVLDYGDSDPYPIAVGKRVLRYHGDGP